MQKMTSTLALGLAALTLAGTAVAKDQVTRAFRSKSHVEVVIDMRDWTWTSVVEGNATHLGRFTGGAIGIVDFSEGFPNPIGEGFETAANGDVLYTYFENPGAGTEGGVKEFNGGTGRFENATGSTIQTQDNVKEIIEWPFIYLSYDDVVTGTITY